MLLNLTVTLESGEVVSGISGTLTTAPYRVSTSDFATIMAAIGANPQSVNVPITGIIALATPSGTIGAIAAKIFADMVKLATTYQSQQAAQAAIATLKPISIAPATAVIASPPTLG